MSKAGKLTVIVLAALLVGGLVTGIAVASIPGPDGTIHGCYKNSTPAQGALLAIDSAASCPSGYTALNWNQTGPQGPAGPPGLSNVHVVTVYGTADANGNGSVVAPCTSGEVGLAGGYNVFPDDDPGNIQVLVDKPLLQTDTQSVGWHLVVRHAPPALTLIVFATCATVQ